MSPPVLVDTGFNTGGYGLYLRDPDGIVVEIQHHKDSVGVRIQGSTIGTQLGRELIQEPFLPRIGTLLRVSR